MKTVILGLALACAAMSVHAERWIMLQEADTGSRLLVDADSFDSGTNDKGVPYAAAMFRFFRDGEARTPFAFVIETASCPSMNGPIYARRYENGKWVTADTYWWSKDGGKMYDAAGELLCNVHNRNKSGSTTPTPQKPQNGKNI